MLLLKLLRERDGAFRIELAMPQSAVQADPAGDDVDVIEVGVVMPDHDMLVIGKAHPLHEVGRDLGPLLRIEMLAFRKGQACMPDRSGHAGTGFP